MAQLINITSEALQATIRRLLPSQQGFGEDLQASNVITPIIDLTPTAEGSEVRQDLQTAIAFGSSTAFDITNATTTLANSPGFWEFQIGWTVRQSSSTINEIGLRLSDGLATKDVWQVETINPGSGSADVFTAGTYRTVIFLRAGDAVVGFATTNSNIAGSYRQIADVSGNLVDPAGFTPQ